MKTIGLVGGTGWISTVEYYRIINQEVNNRLGKSHSARCILYSLNYEELVEFNQQNSREGVFQLINSAAKRISAAGADCIVLCANTLHQFVNRLEAELELPIIHIADATAREITRVNISKVGLLGTRQTMEMDFYKMKLKQHSIETLIPDISEREYIQNTISNELVKNIFVDESRLKFRDIINNLERAGAEGIILGCTEIPLLVNHNDGDIPYFNTLQIHAKAAVDFALG